MEREYLDMFGPPTESFVHDKEIVHQTQEKFEHLKTSIKEVKLNIDSCNAEINDLCSHILNRLFDPRPQVLRVKKNIKIDFRKKLTKKKVKWIVEKTAAVETAKIPAMKSSRATAQPANPVPTTTEQAVDHTPVEIMATMAIKKALWTEVAAMETRVETLEQAPTSPIQILGIRSKRRNIII